MRLLGVAASQPVTLSMSLADAPKHFGALKQNNPDGWGLGWFNGDEPHVVKHALPQTGDVPPEQAAAEATSDVFIAHVRRSSRAPRAPRNSHPFASDGWLFAHSGALYPLLESKVRRLAGRDKPYESQTDSEPMFRFLLASIAEHGDAVAGIRSAVKLLADDGQFSSLNFLLARRGALYAFRYAVRSADYFSLYWLRLNSERPLDFRSRETHAIFRSSDMPVDSIVVCSEELTGGSQCLQMGELLVVKNQARPTAEAVRILTSDS